MHKVSQKSTFLYYPHIINRFYCETLYKSNVSFPGVTLDTVFLADEARSRVSNVTPIAFFSAKKSFFASPKAEIKLQCLNKWSFWSRFWVRKFSMIRRTLQNTWFGTKISREFRIVCIWPFYLRFVVSDPLMAPIFRWWRHNKPRGFPFSWHRFRVSRRQVIYFCRNAHFCAKLWALQSDGNIFETKDYIFFLYETFCKCSNLEKYIFMTISTN